MTWLSYPVPHHPRSPDCAEVTEPARLMTLELRTCSAEELDWSAQFDLVTRAVRGLSSPGWLSLVSEGLVDQH